QAGGVGRQRDEHYLRLFGDDEIEENRSRVREAIVIQAPDMRGEQIGQRGDPAPPRQLRADLEPLGVLVEHRIDDVNEGLVAVEEPVTAGEQITLEQPSHWCSLSISSTRPSSARNSSPSSIAASHCRAVASN